MNVKKKDQKEDLHFLYSFTSWDLTGFLAKK